MALTRYVIIGASAAGMAAAQSIRELDPQGTITVLSAESDQPYFRPLIPFLIDGKKTVADISLLGQGPYTATGIDVRLNSTVSAVSPSNQTVKRCPPLSGQDLSILLEQEYSGVEYVI